MKKLDRKGFTLIELLAVIVILAIIIALVFPQIMNVIDNSKISTIHSNAKSVVNWWETTTSADAIISDESQRQIPADLIEKLNNSWQCVDAVVSENGSSFAKLAGLSDTDYAMGSDYSNSGLPNTVGKTTCSAVKLNASGQLEVLLVAASGGKNYIAGKVTYAFSTDDGGKSDPVS